jgi:flagellar basal-body rod modification protein FlgD
MTTTSSVTSGTTTTSSASTTATKTLASNFQTFLTLLTTQLQNQDPTSPMDSNTFTQQLVMYSQVEQQIASNTNLEKLITLVQGQSNNIAMNYLGKNIVLSDGSGLLESGTGTWSYSLDNASSATSLTVKDSSGNIVYSTQGETTTGTHTFTWDGTNASGDQQSDGLYTLSISATAKDGTAVTTSIASKAAVSGVDMSGSTPQLIIGNSEVPLTSATLVSN